MTVTSPAASAERVSLATRRVGLSASSAQSAAVAPETVIADAKSWSAASGAENSSTSSEPRRRVVAPTNSGGGVCASTSSITYTLRLE